MTRGNLRIYLGAAAGVGTTYAMLSEAQRRRSRGASVEIGCVSPSDRPRTTALADEVNGGAPVPTALDVDALAKSRPNVVLVDDLATDNPAGSRRRHRWQDVDDLLDHGFDVITTLHVQHIAALAEQVRLITGEAPSATVPDEFLARVDQFELIDIAPEAIRRRIAHGNVFGARFEPSKTELYNGEGFAQLRVLLMYWLADRLAVSLRTDAAGLKAHVPGSTVGTDHGARHGGRRGLFSRSR